MKYVSTEDPQAKFYMDFPSPEVQEGTGSVRFVSVLGFSKIHRFGSENYISRFDAVRPAFFGGVVARSASVRFVSASGSGRFQN